MNGAKDREIILESINEGAFAIYGRTGSPPSIQQPNELLMRLAKRR
ncbi:hypothetical protein [Syntrophorhabdus aromaticivorans]|jgi:hypothetical protein|uniref:Uncharacterized protein n=1 Tax=Syntrophorhabdus aromaticivorans TaxID=328301 RepID=A0A971M665_9BACT|nr:hypothetical protein [Syntrophorhabdus aromaticivorans]NLW36009.1 hypothetical protein [Syntrophorhabdus aromaticivorans]